MSSMFAIVVCIRSEDIVISLMVAYQIVDDLTPYTRTIRHRPHVYPTWSARQRRPTSKGIIIGCYMLQTER